jgi:LPS export ABC transporter permease LptG/LPS export ABC transporter permease LptF
MRTGGRLVERYVIGAIIPYLLLSLLLLTAILFTQQVTRLGELLVTSHVPLAMIYSMVLALLPNVLIFTLPMALLTGTLIGFSRMGSDSELVAMRAAGVGTWKMLRPVLLTGALLTGLALYNNLIFAPQSARTLRRTSLQAALYKLDSPVEPRAFNTNIPGYVVYVRDGDKEQGQWGRVFLYKQAADGSTWLVTARSGRIDAAGEQSELVLSDAVMTTLPGKKGEQAGEYVTERLALLRIALDTGRRALLETLRKDEAEPNEMGWEALSRIAASEPGVKGREADTMRQRRLAMSLAPLLFAFLGGAVGLRVRKGGRGIGVLLSVLAMLAYYLISLAGEQLARGGSIPPAVGAWLASGLAVAFGLTLLASQRGTLLRWARNSGPAVTALEPLENLRKRSTDQRGKARLLSFPSLMDVHVLRATSTSFALAFVALIGVFLIFTLSELLRFISARGIGMRVVGEYLFFLLPFVTVQLLPAGVLIAMLATYALMARRSEAVAWWAGGQSVYRLMLPGLFFALCLGGCLWFVQERLMPGSNVRQDALRTQIRGGVLRATTTSDRQWLASVETGRLYAYEYDETESLLREPAIYEFDAEGVHLKRSLAGRTGRWIGQDKLEVREGEALDFTGTGVEREAFARTEVERADSAEVFKPSIDKPSHLSAEGLSDYIKTRGKRGGGSPTLAVALQRKYSEPFGVLVMALTGMPLALSFGRRSAVTALCLAIALGLSFWAVTGGFQQLGSYGMLPPAVAAWAPIVIFAAIGMYLLARART